MKRYDIVLTHDVVKTEYIGNDTVVYTLENGDVFAVTFTVVYENGRKLFERSVVTYDGETYGDRCEFDLFGEGYTTEDYAQWTADNWSEIDELIAHTKNIEKASASSCGLFVVIAMF